jgi:hypothetical protein
VTLKLPATVEIVNKSRGLGGKPLAVITFSVAPGVGIESGVISLTISDPSITSHYEPGESVTITIGGQ